MNGGFDVQIGELGTAARAARSAAGQLARIDPRKDLSPAAAGIPGAASVRVMDRVAAVWMSELSAWEGRAQAYADKLEHAAATYRSSEQAAVTDFTRVDRRVG